MAREIQVLKAYCLQGFKLFPLLRAEKKPAFKGWRESATDNFDQVKEWFKTFPDCNWGIDLAKSGLVAIDIDFAHGGVDKWEALVEQAQSDPSTLKATSGSGLGKHYVFKAASGVKYRGKIIRGIDIKHEGYIAVFPSVHPETGKRYMWQNWAEYHDKIAEVPEWLRELIERRQLTQKSVNTAVNKLGIKYMQTLVHALKEYELSYEEWVSAGMALHACDSGADGLALFVELSRGVSYQSGDEEKARDKWETFNSEGGITPMSLAYILRQKGAVVPNPFTEEDKQTFKQLKLDQINTQKEAHIAKAEESGEVFNLDAEDGERLVSWEKRRIVDWFNDHGYAFLGLGNAKTPILHYSYKGTGLLRTTGASTRGFFEAHAHRFYAFTKVTATDVKKQLEPAAKCWFESSRRRTFESLVFRPQKDEKKGQLNLFREIPCEPVYYGCTPFLELIFESVCNKNQNQFDWLMDWLAHIVQFPHIKATTVPVIVGLQGTGKGLLFDFVMKRILKDLFIAAKTSTELTQQFNAHLANKLLTFVDEATWRGNKTEDGIMKNLIGSPTLSVEEKYGLRYEVDNYSRYAIASNNPEAAALEVDNRRYVFIETGAQFANKPEIFHPYFEEARNGDLAQRFYGYLMRRDLMKFNPYRILANNRAGFTAKVATEGVVAQFWTDLLFEAPKRIFADVNTLSHPLVMKHFLEYATAVKTYERGLNANFFWSKTQKLIPAMPKSHVRKNNHGTTERARDIGPKELFTELCRVLAADMPADFRPGQYVTFTDDTFDPGADF